MMLDISLWHLHFVGICHNSSNSTVVQPTYNELHAENCPPCSFHYILSFVRNLKQFPLYGSYVQGNWHELYHYIFHVGRQDREFWTILYELHMLFSFRWDADCSEWWISRDKEESSFVLFWGICLNGLRQITKALEHCGHS